VANQEANHHIKTEPRFFYGYVVVAVSLLLMLLIYSVRLSFGVFFKPMISEFDWTRTLTSGAFMLSMLVQGCVTIIIGRLNDRFGPRVVMTLCCFFLGLGFLLMSQISYSWQLYLFYGVIIGIGMGGVFVALMSTVARWFVKRRGMMTGIVMAGLNLAAFIVPPVANWLISIYDWRLAYIIIGSAVLVIGILAAQFLKRDPTKVGLLPYGYHSGKELMPASSHEGFSPKEAANTLQFWMVVLIFFCLGYCLFSINVHIILHVTDLGISSTTAAAVLAVTGASGLIGGIVLGGVADRIGSKLVTAIGFTLIMVAFFWLVPITEVWMFYLFAAVFGLGVGGSTPMESTIVAELFGMKSHGAILGTVSSAFIFGGALGPLLTGWFFDSTGNYQLAFLICAAVSVIALIMAIMIRPIKKLNL